MKRIKDAMQEWLGPIADFPIFASDSLLIMIVPAPASATSATSAAEAEERARHMRDLPTPLLMLLNLIGMAPPEAPEPPVTPGQRGQQRQPQSSSDSSSYDSSSYSDSSSNSGSPGYSDSSSGPSQGGMSGTPTPGAPGSSQPLTGVVDEARELVRTVSDFLRRIPKPPPPASANYPIVLGLKEVIHCEIKIVLAMPFDAKETLKAVSFDDFLPDDGVRLLKGILDQGADKISWFATGLSFDKPRYRLTVGMKTASDARQMRNALEGFVDWGIPFVKAMTDASLKQQEIQFAGWGQESPLATRGQGTPSMARGPVSSSMARGPVSSSMARGPGMSSTSSGQVSSSTSRGQVSSSTSGSASSSTSRGQVSSSTSGSASSSTSRGQVSSSTSGSVSSSTARGQVSSSTSRGQGMQPAVGGRDIEIASIERGAQPLQSRAPSPLEWEMVKGMIKMFLPRVEESKLIFEQADETLTPAEAIALGTGYTFVMIQINAARESARRSAETFYRELDLRNEIDFLNERIRQLESNRSSYDSSSYDSSSYGSSSYDSSSSSSSSH